MCRDGPIRRYLFCIFRANNFEIYELGLQDQACPDIISHNVAISRLLRQLVTGGASFELEKSLAEGAGLRGGYSTPDTLVSPEKMLETERLHSELKCSVQSPTHTERRDNFKDNPK